MVSTPFAVAFLAHCASFAVLVQLMSSTDHPLGAMTWSEAAQVLMPLVAMAGLLATVASIYGRLHRAAAAAAGAGTEVAVAILFAAVGLLVNSFVCQTAAEGDDDGGARAREELGLAAAHVLPAAATATFFLAMALICVHLRAGGGGEVAGEGSVQILIKILLGATALLVGLMALAEAH